LLRFLGLLGLTVAAIRMSLDADGARCISEVVRT